MKIRASHKHGPDRARKTRKEKRARLDHDIQEEIGKALRVMYDDVVKQGVPDRFTSLLAKLDKPRDGDENPSAK